MDAPIRTVNRHTPSDEAALAAGGGYCPVHRRFLVLRELEAGCCGWCEPDRFDWKPAERAAIGAMNAPREWPEFTTCATCPAPLPPGNVYHCEPCIEAVGCSMRGTRNGQHGP